MTTPPPRPSVPLTFANEPKIWLGCLECYNNGKLVGDWYTASEVGEVTTSKLHGRPIRPETHEELWGLDVESMPVHREMGQIEAQQWGELYAEVGDGLWPAFCVWVRAEGVTNPDEIDSQTFVDRYRGEWDSFEEYAQDVIASTGEQESWPEDAQRYFDLARYAADLRHGYTVEDCPDGGVYVFSDS